MIKIALIVADSPHLKTEQTILRLLSIGKTAITIVTVPFRGRAPREPLFQHRPDQFASVPLDQLATGLRVALIRTEQITEFDPSSVDYCLMTGGVLLPGEFIEQAKGRVLNCHPGLIPECRGLDALKWAILDGIQVGNTLHFIDSRIDLGRVLVQLPTPVFTSDTLQTFAVRHYEREINLLASFLDYIHLETKDATDLGEVGMPRKRMPASEEKKLLTAFNTYKRKYALDVEDS